MTSNSHPSLVILALFLSLAAGVSLGVTRFAYGLLLPAMKADLNWSYTFSGYMNTMNALGYFLGAMVTPYLIKKWGAVRLLLFSSIISSLMMGLPGLYHQNEALIFQRTISGFFSAFIFVSGGLIAARLGSMAHEKSGFIIGLYYGGTGWGIIFSTLVIPSILELNQNEAHPWKFSWLSMAVVCLLFTFIYWYPLLKIQNMGLHLPSQSNSTEKSTFKMKAILMALMGYGCFGIGYIGYMTFVVLLLKEQGADSKFIQIFYFLLGISVIAGSKIWSGLLNRAKAGEAISLLNFLLGIAAVFPAITQNKFLIMGSGILFGSIFLSVVASTTAFVRHNLPHEEWTRGISLFTIIFAIGQIIGPTAVGFISDGSGNVERGLLFSAFILWFGSFLAWNQKKLIPEDQSKI